jgi:phospholipid-binding lipoprotein MlaA
MNSTIGLGGLIYIAKDTGLPYQSEDFGQTMGVWGVGQGPYLVLPLLGPSTIRDTAGLIVDSYADPVRIYLFNTDHDSWYYIRSGVSSVDKREELLEAIDDLRRHSFDFYAATRSAYLQERQAMVNDKRPHKAAASAAAIPDYDEPRHKAH